MNQTINQSGSIGAELDGTYIPHRRGSGRVTPLTQDLPDMYELPRRRLSPMIAGGLAFALVTCAFYGAQTFFPHPYKPSDLMGGYEREMAMARAEGEAVAKV